MLRATYRKTAAEGAGEANPSFFLSSFTHYTGQFLCSDSERGEREGVGEEWVAAHAQWYGPLDARGKYSELMPGLS